MNSENSEDERSVVRVTSSRAGYAQPTFIIEQQGRFYVTLAVLEYDPKAPGITPEQRDGIMQIEKLFRSGDRSASGVSEVSRGIGGPMPMNTGPMPMNTRP